MNINLTDRHIMALNVLLVAVLAYFAALSVKDVVAFRSTPATAAVPRASSRDVDNLASNRSRTAYQAIVERDLFNLAPPPKAAPPPAKVEDLHLSLIGISQMSKGKAIAIVQDRTGQQSVYRVGEMIPGSGKLLEVDKTRAIIEHGGQRVAIELPKEEMGSPIEGAGNSGIPAFAPPSSDEGFHLPAAPRPVNEPPDASFGEDVSAVPGSLDEEQDSSPPVAEAPHRPGRGHHRHGDD